MNKNSNDPWFIPEIQYEVATKVATYANAQDSTCTLDPATLLIIVNIIVNVIRLVYTCMKDSAVAKMIKNPGRVQRYLLYREVKKSFPKAFLYSLRAIFSCHSYEYRHLLIVCK